MTKKYEKRNVVIIEEHKKDLAKKADKLDMEAVLSYEKDVMKEIEDCLSELESCERLGSSRHAGEMGKFDVTPRKYVLIKPATRMFT